YSAQERKARLSLLDTLAIMHRNADQPDQAVDAFRQEVELDSALAPRVSAEIMETYRQAKQFAKAEQEAESAFKKWPDDKLVVFTRATLLADVGKNDAASSSVKKFVNGKDDREAYLQLAQIYDKGKKFDDTAKALDSAEKLAQNDDDRLNI